MNLSLKDTLNLPETAFPMKADLLEREPQRLQHWEGMDLYKKIQEKNKKGDLFILHDGPPFTNAGIHIGTALNKIVKDLIIYMLTTRKDGIAATLKQEKTKILR